MRALLSLNLNTNKRKQKRTRHQQQQPLLLNLKPNHSLFASSLNYAVEVLDNSFLAYRSLSISVSQDDSNFNGIILFHCYSELKSSSKLAKQSFRHPIE